jgi:hypothetical protein
MEQQRSSSWAGFIIRLSVLLLMYVGKSLNKRNFILKSMENYSQRKILFRDTKWLLSNMPYRGHDDRVVWACAIARKAWPLHCQLAPWKSNEALFFSFVVRRCETFWNLQRNEGSVWRQLFGLGEGVWIGGKISKQKTKRQWVSLHLTTC